MVDATHMFKVMSTMWYISNGRAVWNGDQADQSPPRFHEHPAPQGIASAQPDSSPLF